MSSFSNSIVAIVIVAVAVVLALGLLNLVRQGAGNTSQKLMRWRVGLQFLAIIVIVVVLLMRAH
ncbi:MAG TPA: twin transmembrane helix small protein [Roseiarcus sp.]|jgi:hypothetical protein